MFIGMNGNKKKILITGINGFLGSHLSKSLSQKYEIIGLEYDLNNLFRVKEQSYKIYSSKEDLETIFKEHSIISIIHAATVYRSNDESLESLLETNVLLPIKLFELANRYNVKLFINTDSFFNNSKSKYSYLQGYTLSKKQVLEWLKLICTNNGTCKFANLKLYHMYGENDNNSKFVSQIVSKIKAGETSIKLTKGEQTRDFIYIRDVVSAYEIVLDRIDRIDLISQFEVGTGIETSIKDFVLLMKEVSKNEKIELNFGSIPYRDNEIMKSKANNKDLCLIGWRPSYNLKEGIKNLF